MNLGLILQVAGLIFGALSAWFWAKSALMKIEDVPPIQAQGWFDHDMPVVDTAPLNKFVAELRKQSRLNAIAAIFTALSVACQFIVLCRQFWPHL